MCTFSWDYWPSLNAYSLTIPASYYDAEQRLRVLDRRPGDVDVNVGSATTGPYEDYRYDALGRRILVRSRHDLGCAGSGINPCSDIYSVIERYVWDGDQMLYKIRSPGGDNVTNADLERDTIPIYRVKAPFGRVVYTHGLGIDQPVSVIRMGYSSTWAAPVAVIPHANWRGSFDQGTFDNGAYTRCTKNAQGFNSGDCVFIDWPGDNQRVFENPATVGEPRSWFGHQVSGQRDFSGLFYRRNRYYDAFQGRFTQEDRIGLAGGLNLYGFAKGDPVNFSDPFGDSTFVNCRPFTRGTSGEKHFAHCAVRVRIGTFDRVYQIQPDKKSGTGVSIAGSGPTEELTTAFKQPWIPVAVPGGMSVSQFDQRVLDAVYNYDVTGRGYQHYTPFGEGNSNHFVYESITRAGGMVPIAVTRNVGQLVAPGICGGLLFREGNSCAP